MNKCPYVLKRFHALKKELRIFWTTIFQVPGMHLNLPEARAILQPEGVPHKSGVPLRLFGVGWTTAAQNSCVLYV